jgi:hypothetical protein
MSGTYEILALLNALNEMIGEQGPLILDTGILQHSDNSEKYDPSSDHIIIGEDETEISFDDIYAAFQKMDKIKIFKKELNSGRSYFFEGIRKNKKNPKKFDISWGS